MTRSDSVPTVFISRFNRGACIATWAVLALVAVGVWFLPGGGAKFVALPALATLAGAAYLLLWLPRLEVSDEQIRVRNVLSTIDIPWPALVHVDTKYALTLHVPGRKITVSAAPAPGTVTASRLARRNRRNNSQGGSVGGVDPRPGDLPGTDSGDAAALVRQRWDALRNAGRIEAGIADRTQVNKRWHLLAIVLVLSGAVLSTALALTI